jgi:uncharacterized protein (TIGR00255 family)
MVRSMTGFGMADGPVGRARVTVEVRTVNHRFFSPSIKLPPAHTRWESEVREVMRSRVARGHVTVSVRLERAESAAAGIDEARFAEAAAQLHRLRAAHALDGPVDVAAVLRLPEVITTAREEEEEAAGSAAELVAVVSAALDRLDAARGEEGRRLADVLAERVGLIEGALARIAERAPERLVAQRDRLRAAVRELTDGLAVDEQRLAQEIALLADRMDIAEEQDRFRSHIAAFRTSLAAPGGEPVGKRLGFLLQEMLREANTTGSKAADAAIVADVIVIKEELERIREQVENLE